MIRTVGLGLLGLAAAASPAFAQDPAPTKSLEERVAELEKQAKADKGDLTLRWKNGIRMDSADGAFKLRLAGRIQNDWSWFDHQQDYEDASATPIEAGTEFRRARLAVGGTLYEDFEFMGEYDFAQVTAKFREVWMGMRPAESVIVRAGHFKEPFGFEEMVSDLFTTFLERSAPDEAFCPTFNTGGMASGTAAGKRLWFGAGIFRDANDFGDDTGNTTSGEYAGTARLAGRPWVSADSRRFLHVGGAASYREPAGDTVRFRSRPELHLVPQMVDTGNLPASDVRLVEFDVSPSWDSFTAVLEWFQADVDTRGAADPTFRGIAVQASYFLTGEARPYLEDKAAYDRPIPRANAGKGAGAWEVAARWSRLDLDDAGVNGGTQEIWTAGVNWYLNPNMKIQLDHVRAYVRNVGNLYAVELRFQVDF